MADARTVGLLAYGSLIAHPDWEIEEVRRRIIDGVMTPFPVEFARSSGGRGGAPTLVPYEDGRQVRAQVFVVETSIDDAADRLYRREIDKGGSKRLYKHRDNPGKNAVVIKRLEDFAGIDIVLYTQIAATIDNPSAERLAELAIASVGRTGESRDGISYLLNAMAHGIETPLTADYAEEIKRRTDSNDLAEALAKVKAMLMAE